MRTSIAIVIAGAIVVAVLVAALVGPGESAGPEGEITLRDVVERPQALESRRVTISGEWAQNAFFEPAQADEVIVLGDDAGKHLLVVPELGVDVPPVDEDSVLVVEGVVRLPDRAEAGLLAPDELMETDDGAIAPVLAATRVRLTAGPEPPVAATAQEASIGQLLRDPRAWDERPLVVEGTVSRLTSRGFIFAGDRASIFVSAPASNLSTLQRGESVRLRAELSRLSQYGADALEKALATDAAGEQEAGALDRGEIPIERGVPYLLLRGIANERGPDSGTAGS